MKRIGIFGTSGFAREVADIAWELSYRPLFVARDATELAHWDGSDDVIVEEEAGKYGDIPFAVGIGNQAVRQRLVGRYPALEFANLIHPAASFGRGQREAVKGRRGVIVAAGVRLSNRIQVGDFTVFDRNATVGHDCIVDEFAHIAPAACVSGNVHLESACWIGAGAVINQGNAQSKLIIGNNSVIGSGAVVIGPCEAHGVYAGVPARRIK